MSQPNQSSSVNFVYVPAGESLPVSLDNNTIYFDANTQRLIVGGGDVSIYNPVVYRDDPQTAQLAPQTLLVTQDQYNDFVSSGTLDEDILYLIYEQEESEPASNPATP